MKKISFLLMCLLFTFGLKAQITRQQADAIVTNQIFSTNLNNVDIYAFPNMMTSSVRIDLADGTSVAVPYHTCYAYFIDLMPLANWSHPCKYCFVDLNGNSSLVDKNVQPMNWSNLSMVSLKQRPTSVQYTYRCDESIQPESPETNPHLWAVLICANTRGDYYTEYRHRYWGDLSCVYTTLTNVYGFQENTLEDPYSDITDTHILVFVPTMLNGYNDNELNSTGGGSSNRYNDYFAMRNNEYGPYHTELGSGFSYNKSELSRLFSKLSEILTYEDQLFIYVTGNGVDYPAVGFEMPNGNQGNGIIVTPADLSSFVEDIKCSQMTLVMQNNFSGSFKDSFMDCEGDMCENRIVLTATDANSFSFPEMYITRRSQTPNHFECENVNEFTYYWAASQLGYYPYIDTYQETVVGPWIYPGFGIIGSTEGNAMPWSTFFPNESQNAHNDYDISPDSDDDGVLSLEECYTFANNLDSWTDIGYFNPHPFYPNWFESPQSAYESTFTAEAATLVGYEGQVDGDVTSGTARQPYRLCGDLWTGPHTRVDMTDDIYVPEGNKIYIQPSSHIQLRNCTVDKLPESNGMWEGIQVWGQNDQPQDLQHQGGLYMDNASIKNAIVAVDLWNPNHWHSMGGTIRANNSSFINNGRAIHALNYVYESTAFMPTFNNCRFYVGNDNDETYLGPTTFYKHIDLANVRGVKFYGCDFGLDCVNSFISDWTIGIAAYNSGFEVEKLNSKRSTFNGFFRGVQALNDGTITRSFSVKNSDFTNNDYGIFARAADEPVILNNTFSIGLDNWYSCAAGIQLEGISNFVVEGNAVTKEDNYRNDNFGIIIKDSQTEGNQVYLNDLDGLYCGNLAWGDNRGNNNDLGLEYYCNSNADNAFDFYVKYENPGTDIQQDQGNIDFDPHNTFSNGNNLLSNFYNQGEHEVYYYEYVNGSYNLDTYRVLFKKSNNLHDCQPHYGSGGNAHNGSSTPVLSTAQKQQCQTDYANALNTYNSVKNVYDRLTDGGSTNSTVADIRSAMPSDMWELRSKLLGSSPYLSEEVLKETADRDDVFTESILFEILASNPDELRKGDIIKYVEDKEHPLPEYMVDILRQLSTGTTTNKTLLLNSMASSRHDYRQAAADMVRSILADSIVDVTELRGWLANMNDLSADRQIISTYMAEGDFGTAFLLANMLPALYEFDATALAEHDDYMELLGLYRNLRNDGRSTLQLTESETEDVEDIAINGTGLPQYMAQSLLEATTERYHFAECPLIDEPSGMGRGIPQGYTQEDLSKAMGLSVSAKPNPATTWVAIDFTLPGDAKTAAVEIVNSLGEKVMQSQLNGNVGQKVLDLRELSNGVYTITILCGEYYQTEKLVVAK